MNPISNDYDVLKMRSKRILLGFALLFCCVLTPFCDGRADITINARTATYVFTDSKTPHERLNRLGCDINAHYQYQNLSADSTSYSLSFELYEGSDDRAVSLKSAKMVSDLKLEYLTSERGMRKTISPYGRLYVQKDEWVTFSLTGKLLENNTDVERCVGVKLICDYLAVPIWFVFYQAAGNSKVVVTMNTNGGTLPYPTYQEKYTYSNGSRFGYKQTTMIPKTGAVSLEDVAAYEASYVMPYTTREGYVFDAWYTPSGERITEESRTTATVTEIIARWLYAVPENFQAEDDGNGAIWLTWDPISAIGVSYSLYRSETTERPSLPIVSNLTSCEYTDLDVSRGERYYYWIMGESATTTSVVGGPISASCDLERVSTPMITPVDGTVFSGSARKVTIKCVTPGAVIHYTTDGSDPTEDSPIYCGAFSTAQSMVVKAVAVASGMHCSEVSVSAFARYEDALDSGTLLFSVRGDSGWVTVAGDAPKVGTFCLRSGQIGDGQSTVLSTTVTGKGTLEFWWRVSCEHDPSGSVGWDAAIFSAPDSEQGEIRRDGIQSVWEKVCVPFTSGGEHSISWTFAKDESDDNIRSYEDCVYVDGISWISADGYTLQLRISDTETPFAVRLLNTDCVYELPACTATPPVGKTRFAGWQCSNGRRYDDGVLVFNLVEPGETVTMTAIWE